MLRTEIPGQYVYEGLQAAKTTDVHIFGRRGPAQTKFSPLEARELAHPKGLQVVMEARDLEQITDAEWDQIEADKRTDQVVQTFVGWLRAAARGRRRTRRTARAARSAPPAHALLASPQSRSSAR